MRLGVSLFVAAAVGCARDGAPAGDDVAARAPLAPQPPPAPDSAAPAADSAPASPEADATPAVEPVGGPWVTCYAHFHPTSTPRRDVQRLGLLCGPASGMRRVGETLEGVASAGGADHAFDARAGECFRLFVVAEASVAVLGVQLRDPKGDELAADHADDRWPVVNPDGPVCVKDDGRFTVHVHARKGAGAYALQIWKLPLR